MDNNNPPKQRRSFRVIFKIIKFLIAMALTFFISFAVTLVIKYNDSANFLDEEEEISTGTQPEIKTIFDEQNNQPFNPQKYNGKVDKKSARTEKETEPVRAENISTDDKRSVQTENISAGDKPLPPRQAEELGVLDTLNRITSIKPAVDAKIRDISHYITLDKMPSILCQAIIAVEDNRFYTHKGFDLISIARAVLVNVEAGEIQEGASTITQQTVKNLFLTSDQTFTRKAEELILSMNMEKDFDKDKILEIYLNVIYFGSNFYGVYDAAQGYFGKEPADLTIAECAMLAGLPNAPSLYSPYVDFHLAKQRQLVVIDAMEKVGVISKTEAENARIEEIILAR